ncbi:MAG TPA: hypothetical protein VGD91_19375 [Trebonia sp.]
MTALYINGIEMTQPVAAELLALAPDVPDAAEPLNALTTDAAMAAIHQVLTAYHCDLAECDAEWMRRYLEDPAYVSARRTRCTIVASRLVGVQP